MLSHNFILILKTNFQEAHEKIRKVSLAAHEKKKKNESVSLSSMLAGDSFFEPVREKLADLESDAGLLIGRCPEQVEEFVLQELQLALKAFAGVPVNEALLTV